MNFLWVEDWAFHWGLSVRIQLRLMMSRDSECTNATRGGWVAGAACADEQGLMGGVLAHFGARAQHWWSLEVR